MRKLFFLRTPRRCFLSTRSIFHRHIASRSRRCHNVAGYPSTGRLTGFDSIQKVRRVFSVQDNLFDRCIKRQTTVAPHSQKVPTPVVLSIFTIVAINSNDPCHIGRDRLQGYSHGNGRPRGGHLFGRFSRFLAHGTARIVRCQFLETVPMNGMSAGHFVGGMPAGKQIFLTNGAIAHVFAGFAIVIVKQNGINAHAAIVTVAKVFASADTTKATIFAVVGMFLTGHPQIANVAVIFTEIDTALCAVVPLLGEKRGKEERGG
jgi:hypothetical protein